MVGQVEIVRRQEKLKYEEELKIAKEREFFRRQIEEQ